MSAKNKWYKLDNAAKIIPSTAEGTDTRVFRLTCELKEEVEPDALQRALDRTIREFPYLNCCLKRGMFWYYMESSRLRPAVTEDRLAACSPIYVRGRKNLLYRVNYFGKRINLEMYHVLADGTGAFMFLRHLVMNYLIDRHHISEHAEGGTASVADKTEDAFNHFYQKRKNRNIIENIKANSTKAYQIRGERDEDLRLHLLEGTVSVRKFIEAAHRYHTTVAILSVSVYIEAIIGQMNVRDYEKPIVISVPVNLRNYFPSETARNFFGVINIVYSAKHYDGSLDSIIPSVKKSFQDQLTKEKIFQTMNTYAALEHNWIVKMVPLLFKDIGIASFNRMRMQEVTTTLSNVGKVEMPDPFVPYIEKFCSFMAARNLQITISSFQDNLVFGVTSAFRSHEVMKNFFRRLTALGMEVVLDTNDYDVPPVGEKA